MVKPMSHMTPEEVRKRYGEIALGKQGEAPNVSGLGPDAEYWGTCMGSQSGLAVLQALAGALCEATEKGRCASLNAFLRHAGLSVRWDDTISCYVVIPEKVANW